MTRHESLADRVRRLTDTLSALRDRVREAVASELGAAVGRAAQDILAALAGGRPTPVSPRPAYHPTGSWSGDPWADDGDVDDDLPVRPAWDGPAEPAAPEFAGRLPAVVSAGWAVAHGWVTRGGPAWAGLGLGLVAAACAWWGGPLARAAAGAAAAAAELLALARPSIPLPALGINT